MNEFRFVFQNRQAHPASGEFGCVRGDLFPGSFDLFYYNAPSSRRRMRQPHCSKALGERQGAGRAQLASYQIVERISEIRAEHCLVGKLRGTVSRYGDRFGPGSPSLAVRPLARPPKVTSRDSTCRRRRLYTFLPMAGSIKQKKAEE